MFVLIEGEELTGEEERFVHKKSPEATTRFCCSAALNLVFASYPTFLGRAGTMIPTTAAAISASQDEREGRKGETKQVSAAAIRLATETRRDGIKSNLPTSPFHLPILRQT